MNTLGLETALVESVDADSLLQNVYGYRHITPADVDKWIASATEFALEAHKAKITERFAQLKPPLWTKQDSSDKTKWDELANLGHNRAEYLKRLADRLSVLVCERDGAPYVARGILLQSARQGAIGRLVELGE